MTLHQSQLQDHFEEFRKNFRSIRVTQDDNYLVYGYPNIRHAAVSCSEANLLIERLNLPLVAIHNGNSDCFYIQSNEISDI